MQTLSGKTAFITGGASGIGFAMARAFLAEGMQVANDKYTLETIERIKHENIYRFTRGSLRPQHT